MTSAIFDDITRVFLTALEAGTLVLGSIPCPLLWLWP